MRQCEPWKTASDAEFDNAMEGMEKLVMNQLYQYTFTPAVAKDLNPITGLPRRPISVDDLERDRILSERIALFGWVEEKHLDIPVEEGTAGFLMFAEQGSFFLSLSVVSPRLDMSFSVRVAQDWTLQGSQRQAYLYPELLQGHLWSASRPLFSSLSFPFSTPHAFPTSRIRAQVMY